MRPTVGARGGAAAMRSWAGWVLAVFGVWLAVSVWVFGLSGTAWWSDLVVGVVTTVSILYGASQRGHRWQGLIDRVLAVFGAWFIVSGFVFSSIARGPALWSNLILGILMLVGALSLVAGIGEEGNASPRKTAGA